MAGVKILLIDDDRSLVRALGARLRREGFEPLSAFDAVQGMIMARKEMPALIVLDMAFPGGDGLRLLDNLSRSSTTSGIPVIVNTGSSDAARLEQARALGAIDCFVKGADVQSLIARIHAVVGTPAPAGGSPPQVPPAA